MASLFKQQVVRYVDEKGRRVPKLTQGARRVCEKSRKWYGEYKDEHERTQRVALSTDKSAAQTLLNDILRNVERRRSGIFNPYEEHGKLPLSQHISDYREFLNAKDNTTKHVEQTIGRIKRLCEGCNFFRLEDIDGTRVACWLSDKRMTSRRFSAQTSNFYLDALKYFCDWLVRHDRMPKNPVGTINRIRVDADRRHDRRALSDEEFARLIRAAELGPSIEGLSGPDRAMLYILAAWTGFRRRELSSITRSSIDLSDSGQITVMAGYSKRRRKDTIPLHPWVVTRLKQWLDTKRLFGPKETIFALRTASGHYRKTAKMMKKDLASARQAWLEEAPTPEERERRNLSDFLTYQNSAGDFADFHANRHTFISLLGREGVPLAVAQKLARHSDPRLTANTYTHLEMRDKEKAIHGLPTPSMDSSTEELTFPDYTSDILVTGMVTGTPVICCPGLSSGDSTDEFVSPSQRKDKPLSKQGLDAESQPMSPADEVHPRGLEPLTFGSVNRCSIQLS